MQSLSTLTNQSTQKLTAATVAQTEVSKLRHDMDVLKADLQAVRQITDLQGASQSVCYQIYLSVCCVCYYDAKAIWHHIVFPQFVLFVFCNRFHFILSGHTY